MHDALALYRERGPAALWDRTLGHFDLTLEQAMATQRQLMTARLRTLSDTALGGGILNGKAIGTIDEFRERFPLTRYEDYEPTLGQRREDVLDGPPAAWVRTSGKTRAQANWIPIGPHQFEELNWYMTAIMILSAARERGDVRLQPNARLLNMTAPAPYASGTFMDALATSQWPFRYFPKPETQGMEFAARMASAFSDAITEGVNYVIGLPSVLSGLGEAFGQRKPPGTILDRLKNPRAFARMGRAALRAKLAGRPLYPGDALKPLGIPVGGGDSSLFRERIKQYWGVYPLEMFVSSEGLMVALQAWDRTSLTFPVALNFLEFIPEDEVVSNPEDNGDHLRTVLFDELEPGKNYELVLTTLHDGPLTRYRTGDVFRVVGMEDARAGIHLPQVVSYGRYSETVDLAGFVRLNEQTVWRAIEEADIPYVEWTARKEVIDSNPTLHLRIEPRPGSPVRVEDAKERIDAVLRRLEPDWADLATMAGLRPLVVTYLPQGAFDRYTESRRRAGADLGHLKPLHMNASDAAISELLSAAEAVPTGSQR